MGNARCDERGSIGMRSRGVKKTGPETGPERPSQSLPVVRFVTTDDDGVEPTTTVTPGKPLPGG